MDSLQMNSSNDYMKMMGKLLSRSVSHTEYGLHEKSTFPETFLSTWVNDMYNIQHLCMYESEKQ